MTNRITHSTSSLIIVTAILLSAAVARAAAVQALASDAGAVTFEWTADLKTSSLRSPGDWTTYLPSVDWQSDGNVLTPYQVVLVACPIGTTPRLTINSTSYSEYAVPLPLNESEPSAKQPRQDQVRVKSVESWRGFQIAHIEMRVAESLPAGASLLSSARVTVEFTGARAADAPTSRETEMLGALCVNGVQASRWWQLKTTSRATLDNALDSWPEFQLYKLGLTETGLYAITTEWMQSQGIPALGVQSSQLKMFGNGGRLLPAGLLSVPDSVLREVAILIEDGGDGRMDQGDRVQIGRAHV